LRYFWQPTGKEKDFAVAMYIERLYRRRTEVEQVTVTLKFFRVLTTIIMHRHSNVCNNCRILLQIAVNVVACVPKRTLLMCS